MHDFHFPTSANAKPSQGRLPQEALPSGVPKPGTTGRHGENQSSDQTFAAVFGKGGRLDQTNDPELRGETLQTQAQTKGPTGSTEARSDPIAVPSADENLHVGDESVDEPVADQKIRTSNRFSDAAVTPRVATAINIGGQAEPRKPNTEALEPQNGSGATDTPRHPLLPDESRHVRIPAAEFAVERQMSTIDAPRRDALMPRLPSLQKAASSKSPPVLSVNATIQTAPAAEAGEVGVERSVIKDEGESKALRVSPNLGDPQSVRSGATRPMSSITDENHDLNATRTAPSNQSTDRYTMFPTATKAETNSQRSDPASAYIPSAKGAAKRPEPTFMYDADGTDAAYTAPPTQSANRYGVRPLESEAEANSQRSDPTLAHIHSAKGAAKGSDPSIIYHAGRTDAFRTSSPGQSSNQYGVRPLASEAETSVVQRDFTASLPRLVNHVAPHQMATEAIEIDAHQSRPAPSKLHLGDHHVAPLTTAAEQVKRVELWSHGTKLHTSARNLDTPIIGAVPSDAGSNLSRSDVQQPVQTSVVKQQMATSTKPHDTSATPMDDSALIEQSKIVPGNSPVKVRAESVHLAPTARSPADPQIQTVVHASGRPIASDLTPGEIQSGLPGAPDPQGNRMVQTWPTHPSETLLRQQASETTFPAGRPQPPTDKNGGASGNPVVRQMPEAHVVAATAQNTSLRSSLPLQHHRDGDAALIPPRTAQMRAPQPVFTSAPIAAPMVHASQSIRTTIREVAPDLSWDPVAATTKTTTLLQTRADLPVQIARQLAEIMPQMQSRQVDIALSPEELGRVRLTVTTGENAITVNILAERAETLELMRRNIDQLGQEFQSLGYHNIAFSFADGQQPTDGGSEQSGNDDSNAQSTTNHSDETLPEISIALGATTGVDLRL